MFDEFFSQKFMKFEMKIRRIITLHGTTHVKNLMLSSGFFFLKEGGALRNNIVRDKIKKSSLKQRVSDT